MRILLLTDSLGCPRSDIHVSKTWTDEILRAWSSTNITIYTYCKHGLSANMIDMDYIKEIEPDIIIAQFGIVDACRRALKHREMVIASMIPGVGENIKRYCSDHHYALTSKRNIHYCYLTQFKQIVEDISRKGRVYFIRICPPGKFLKERTYNVENDINIYNNEIKKIANIIYLDPYMDMKPEKYLLNDGHHLTEYGHELVFKCVCNRLSEIIERREE